MQKWNVTVMMYGSVQTTCMPSNVVNADNDSSPENAGGRSEFSGRLREMEPVTIRQLCTCMYPSIEAHRDSDNLLDNG